MNELSNGVFGKGDRFFSDGNTNKNKGCFFLFGVYLYNLVYFDKPVGSRKKYDPGRVSKLNTLSEFHNDFVTKLKIISIDLLYRKKITETS